MKKTIYASKVLLTILLVSAVLSAIVELSISYFGIIKVLATLLIMFIISIIITLLPSRESRKPETQKQRNRFRKGLTEEALREKYCK